MSLGHNYFLFEGDYYFQKQGTAMGTNFAPSYSNLTMGLWETRCIWVNNPFAAHLIFYGRYIDDIIIILDGPLSSLQEFVAHCNSIIFGLSFTSVVDPVSICFLDLELFYTNSLIIAKNYTKPTAGNSFLHYSS